MGHILRKESSTTLCHSFFNKFCWEDKLYGTRKKNWTDKINWNMADVFSLSKVILEVVLLTEINNDPVSI